MSVTIEIEKDDSMSFVNVEIICVPGKITSFVLS